MQKIMAGVFWLEWLIITDSALIDVVRALDSGTVVFQMSVKAVTVTFNTPLFFNLVSIHGVVNITSMSYPYKSYMLF